MALGKGFLRVKIGDKIPFYKYIVGIIIGLLLAFSFYSFQYLFREVIRVLSITDEYDIWILTDEEVEFYNLIFAYISVIFGQSICFIYWFHRPYHVFKAGRNRIASLVNGQQFVLWNFLSWFGRVATMYGALLMVTQYFLLKTKLNFDFLFPLIIIVLFINSWNSILLIFKKKAFKWMLLSAIIISIVSFGFSKINLIDYNALNNSVLQRRIDVKYQLNLVVSETFEVEHRYNYLSKVSLVLPKNQSKMAKPFLMLANEKVDFDDIAMLLINLRSSRNDAEYLHYPLNLRIDEDVQLKYIYRLKKVLAGADIAVLNFMVIPANAVYEDRYYVSSKAHFISLVNDEHPFYTELKNQMENLTTQNFNKIEFLNNGVSINNDFIDRNLLKNKIKNIIINDSEYRFVINTFEETRFGDYILSISCLKSAIKELREEYALKEYARPYKDLNKDTKRLIIDKYPSRYYVRIIEVDEITQN